MSHHLAMTRVNRYGSGFGVSTFLFSQCRAYTANERAHSCSNGPVGNPNRSPHCSNGIANHVAVFRAFRCPGRKPTVHCNNTECKHRDPPGLEPLADAVHRRLGVGKHSMPCQLLQLHAKLQVSVADMEITARTNPGRWRKRLLAIGTCKCKLDA
jgi:hypothetical protein